MVWTEMYVGIVQAAVLLGYRCVRRALRRLAPPLGLCGISATSKVTRCVCVTGISPLQSITHLRHRHHSSCTVCLRAQYWGPFSSSCTLRLSPIANHSVNHQLFADDAQLQKSAPSLSEVTNLTKELNAFTCVFVVRFFNYFIFIFYFLNNTLCKLFW